MLWMTICRMDRRPEMSLSLPNLTPLSAPATTMILSLALIARTQIYDNVSLPISRATVFLSLAQDCFSLTQDSLLADVLPIGAALDPTRYWG